jgi:thioredoxin:protein disulfide reductase
MTRSTRILINCFLLLVVISGCYRSVQNSTSQSAPTPEGLKITSESVVSATADAVEIPAGGSAEAVVRVTVQNGYHINANPPTYHYLKATELELAGTDVLSVGFIRYPDPLTKKFAFAEKPLDVYEGETSLKVFLNAAKSAKQGKQSLSGKLRIQACDDQVCYPPGLKEIVIPVLIK